MTRAEKIILGATLAIVLLLVVLETITPKEPNWTPTYTEYRNDPYACSLVRQRLGDLFPQGITTVREPIYATAQRQLSPDSAAPRVNHVFVERWLNLDPLDLQHLLKMVEAGDNAFIAAEGFGSMIEDTLGLSTAYRYEPLDSLSAQGIKEILLGDTAVLHYTVEPVRKAGEFRFGRGDMRNYLSKYAKDSAQVLAETWRNDPVLLRVPIGKGTLYLCSTPLAFTNYYLLKDDARGFMEKAFGLLPDRPVLWDEYYKAGRAGSTSPLRYILAQPALRWAYWTVIALLLLTVLVYARRRQRAIPVVAPPRNSSRDFADTMGRLYYFRGDHADLARKLSAQFREEVRRKLRLPQSEWDNRTLVEIARRSGIGEEELHHANRLMDFYATAELASEQQLLTLNKTLDRLRHKL
ncbi:MAG TPA: hypothetical protein PLV70_05640 [Flavobacteriales bacterium]|nr:hypothetical protein [Flavobacteriales bacterium]HRQ84577.1 hypothetical protein [Flavobacteriales bacterium]